MTIVQSIFIVIFNHHFYSQAKIVRCSTLSDLLDKDMHSHRFLLLLPPGACAVVVVALLHTVLTVKTYDR